MPAGGFKVEGVYRTMLTQARIEERKSGIGGSDVPVILGLSPYKTPYELWQEKTGRKSGFVDSPAIQRGNVLEPVAAVQYAQVTGRKLRKVNELLKHSEYHFMLANVDRHIVAENGSGPGILEIKCPGLQVFARAKREGVSQAYLAQLQHYLMVKSWAWGSIAIFNAERWELLHFDVKRDPEMGEAILKAAVDFWGYVERDEPPPQAAVELPSMPHVGSELVQIGTDDWVKAVDWLRYGRELKEEGDRIEAQAKENMLALMAGASVAEGAGLRVYHKIQPGRVSIDAKALKHDMPEVFSKYARVGKPFETFKPYFLTGGIES
jgi:putative phage-type endonuclease